MFSLMLTVSVLVGGHFFSAPADALRPWLYAVIATGAGLMGTDVLKGIGYLREVRGAAILLKLVVVASVTWLWDLRVALLFAVIVLSGIVSHMSGRYRYWVLGKGPYTGSTSKEPRGGLG